MSTFKHWTDRDAILHNQHVREMKSRLYGIITPELGRVIKDRVQRRMPEAELHNAIIAECRRRGWQYLHGSMAAETHRTLGEPDFVLMASDGRVFFIECKSRDGKLSPAQRDFAAHAERNGHRVHVVRSFEEFINLTRGIIYNVTPKNLNKKGVL